MCTCRDTNGSPSSILIAHCLESCSSYQDFSWFLRCNVWILLRYFIENCQKISQNFRNESKLNKGVWQGKLYFGFLLKRGSYWHALSDCFFENVLRCQRERATIQPPFNRDFRGKVCAIHRTSLEKWILMSQFIKI